MESRIMSWINWIITFLVVLVVLAMVVGFFGVFFYEKAALWVKSIQSKMEDAKSRRKGH